MYNFLKINCVCIDHQAKLSKNQTRKRLPLSVCIIYKSRHVLLCSQLVKSNKRTFRNNSRQKYCVIKKIKDLDNDCTR